MRRLLLLVAVPGLLAAGVLLSCERLPRGTYRRPAPARTLRKWEDHYRAKRDLVPPPPPPRPSEGTAVDFRGTFRFGRYDYRLVIEQTGDRVTFRSGGVDQQDIGGAFETVGTGTVDGDRLRARWWCFDLTRNYANNGGCEMWFHEGDRNLLWARYYHDADEAIEEGYGVRAGTHEGRRLHYRIRVRKRTERFGRPRLLSGTVRGGDGEALRDAVVMLRHDEQSAVRTDAAGRWQLRVAAMPYVLMLSAAAPGYRTQVQALLLHEIRPLHFVLDPSPFRDDARYRFVDPTPNKQREIWNCGNCHRNSYAEWKESRHAVAARSAVTRAVFRRDFLPALAAGRATVADAGLCAGCHAPQAALDGKTTRLDRVQGVALLGNHCDFCHKIHHTEDVEAPGVRGSLRLGRPAPDDHRVPGPIKRVYGPLADIDYLFMGPVYNPFFTTGALCAGCHQYTTPDGVPALATYTEWRGWAASRRRHESCQSCHMPTGTSVEGDRLARRICVNALRRPTAQIHDHGFQGRELAPAVVDLKVTAKVTGERLAVTTTVSAGEEAGHKVPTGSGDKHLLLLVLAADAAGRPYPLRAGPRVPAHAGGAGDPTRLDAGALDRRLEEGEFAGLPGREFAQVLADGEGRTHVPFWRAVRVVEDSRLVPGAPVTVPHLFEVGGQRPVSVRVEVWHRLRYKEHDVAGAVQGPGVRPLDLLLATTSVDVR
ncbi:MAG: multiheme c-type cytochrome [Planctomycetota bacterium]|jgi:hypothetical protein